VSDRGVLEDTEARWVPAQFIASTWKLFEDRLQSALGHDPNPWAAEDAFTASAMYLGDLGASTGTYSGEIKAGV